MKLLKALEGSEMIVRRCDRAQELLTLRFLKGRVFFLLLVFYFEVLLVEDD